MNKRRVLRATWLGLGIALAAAFSAGDVAAQKASVGGKDKEIATKKGVSESLGNKEFDEDKLPGTLEVGLALGSIAAVVAAMKWL